MRKKLENPREPLTLCTILSFSRAKIVNTLCTGRKDKKNKVDVHPRRTGVKCTSTVTLSHGEPCISMLNLPNRFSYLLIFEIKKFIRSDDGFALLNKFYMFFLYECYFCY